MPIQRAYFFYKKCSNFGPFGHVKIVHSNKGQDKALTLHCGKCVQPWFNVWEFHVWVRLRVRVSAMLTGKFLQIRMNRTVEPDDLQIIGMIWRVSGWSESVWMIWKGLYFVDTYFKSMNSNYFFYWYWYWNCCLTHFCCKFDNAI